MKNQNAVKNQSFDLTEFESKKLRTTSVTIYDTHRDWLDKKEESGNRLNISKLLRAVLDQLMAAEKR